MGDVMRLAGALLVLAACEAASFAAADAQDQGLCRAVQEEIDEQRRLQFAPKRFLQPNLSTREELFGSRKAAWACDSSAERVGESWSFKKSLKKAKAKLKKTAK